MFQVVAETDEPFVPVPDDLIVNLRESREAVEALLDNLASSFATATSVSPATAAANAATPTSYDYAAQQRNSIVCILAVMIL